MRFVTIFANRAFISRSVRLDLAQAVAVKSYAYLNRVNFNLTEGTNL